MLLLVLLSLTKRQRLNIEKMMSHVNRALFCEYETNFLNCAIGVLNRFYVAMYNHLKYTNYLDLK